MTLASPKNTATMPVFPRTILSIAVLVGGLATFLFLASWLLVSYPIGSAVRGYFYGVDGLKRLDLPTLSGNNYSIDHLLDHDSVDVVDKNNSSGSNGEVPVSSDRLSDNNASVLDNNSSPAEPNLERPMSSSPLTDEDVAVIHKNLSTTESSSQVPTSEFETVGQATPAPGNSSDLTLEGEQPKIGSAFSNTTGSVEILKPLSPGAPQNFGSVDKGSNDTNPGTFASDSKSGARPDIPVLAGNANKTGSVEPDCDLYRGNWFYDPTGPVYTNNSCPVITQMQNCQGNGRPDKDYENWRWKPSGCDLPRFDGKKFLELMRGKTLAFIGDSVARNQMESLLCLLWQAEIPKNRGSRRMQRWYFRSTSTMIVRIWSSWLVHKTSENFDFAPEGVVKLHLDAPDEDFMEFIPNFDVVVLSSGHWFAKQSVYILNNEIVGGQLWWPDKSRPMKINNIQAFGISVETALTAVVTNPNFTGIAIVRSFSPDHYEGGAWNTGGSCTGKVKPLAAGKLVENGFTNVMHKEQVMGFNRAIKKAPNKSKLRLMDITEAFGYRHDGHPGPYRNPDPNKITKRGPGGRPPPQDCLHWCMPGPVDTWNELVLEIIRREYEGKQSFPS